MRLDLSSFCYYPFIQLLMTPNGQVFPCCWKLDYSLGDIKNSTIQEIWNSPEAQKLRQEFLNGKPTTCAKEMKHLGCHLTSQRWYTQDVKKAIVQKDPPRRLDLRLNGKCNLQCIMCNVWEMPNGNYNEKNFWSLGRRDIFPGLEEIIMLGGEPFIQKDTFRLIEEVSEVNQRCKWGFITNGQYRIGEKILRALDKIEIRYIQVSLDSINPETYKKIRKKGELERALESLQKFISLSQEREKQDRGFVVSVAMCVQQSNWSEIEDFFNFARPLGLEVGLQFVTEPITESLLSLPKQNREEIYSQLLNLQKKMSIDQLKVVLGPLKESFDSEVLSQ